MDDVDYVRGPNGGKLWWHLHDEYIAEYGFSYTNDWKDDEYVVITISWLQDMLRKLEWEE